jgi:hypothetical protein
MDRPQFAAPLTTSATANELSASKARLRETSRAVDPLKSLRDHPLLIVTSAATLGVVAASPAAARWARSTAFTLLFRSVVNMAERFRQRPMPPCDPNADSPPSDGHPVAGDSA